MNLLYVFQINSFILAKFMQEMFVQCNNWIIQKSLRFFYALEFFTQNKKRNHCEKKITKLFYFFFNKQKKTKLFYSGSINTYL